LMLEASEVTQGYGRRTVLHSFSYRFGLGIHGILGPNGAGKTTLLTTLAILRSPKAGTVKLDGNSTDRGVSLRNARRRISFLPQGFAYPASFNVNDFLAYSAWVREVPSSVAQARAGELLEQLGLTSFATTKLRKLSGGTLQRAGIAQALMSDPSVLILDEPTVGLDPAQRLALRQSLTAMAHDRCVLLSTHLVEDVMQVCQQVSVMADGRVVFSGPPDQLTAFGSGGAPGMSAAEAGYLAVIDRANPVHTPEQHQ
jgi:ABC-2 type transport system ATP-binding protein